jgi:hypothetical protein
MSKTAHLCVYRFEAGTVFEGSLLAAIERMESGRNGELLDALLLTREAASGAFEAVDLVTGRADATLASLLDFRLDPGRRRALTERTLAEHPGGVPKQSIEAIAATLRRGEAISTVLHSGPAAPVLDEAVERCGGRRIADEPAHARTLADIVQRLCALVTSSEWVPPSDRG